MLTGRAARGTTWVTMDEWIEQYSTPDDRPAKRRRRQEAAQRRRRSHATKPPAKNPKRRAPAHPEAAPTRSRPTARPSGPTPSAGSPRPPRGTSPASLEAALPRIPEQALRLGAAAASRWRSSCSSARSAPEASGRSDVPPLRRDGRLVHRRAVRAAHRRRLRVLPLEQQLPAPGRAGAAHRRPPGPLLHRRPDRRPLRPAPAHGRRACPCRPSSTACRQSTDLVTVGIGANNGRLYARMATVCRRRPDLPAVRRARLAGAIVDQVQPAAGPDPRAGQGAGTRRRACCWSATPSCCPRAATAPGCPGCAPQDRATFRDDQPAAALRDARLSQGGRRGVRRLLRGLDRPRRLLAPPLGAGPGRQPPGRGLHPLAPARRRWPGRSRKSSGTSRAPRRRRRE